MKVLLHQICSYGSHICRVYGTSHGWLPTCIVDITELEIFMSISLWITFISICVFFEIFIVFCDLILHTDLVQFCLYEIVKKIQQDC